MSFNSGFRYGFLHGQGSAQIDHARRVELGKPFPGNDPALLAPTRCNVLKPFFVNGKRVEAGEIVMLPKHDADSLRALGKVALV